MLPSTNTELSRDIAQPALGVTLPQLSRGLEDNTLPADIFAVDFPSKLKKNELLSDTWQSFVKQDRETRFDICLTSISTHYEDIKQRAVAIFNTLSYIQVEALWKVNDHDQTTWYDWIKNSIWVSEIKTACLYIYEEKRYVCDYLSSTARVSHLNFSQASEMATIRTAWPEMNESSLLEIIPPQYRPQIWVPRYARSFARIARTGITASDLTTSLCTWLTARPLKQNHRSCSARDIDEFSFSLAPSETQKPKPAAKNTTRISASTVTNGNDELYSIQRKSQQTDTRSTNGHLRYV
jgi:hypothetical protein